MAGNVRGTGSGLFPAWGRVFRFKEELASRQGRGTGPRVPGRELPGFCGSENPYGKRLRGSPPRRGRPQKGADTAGSGGMAPPASGTGSLPLRYCGSPVPGGEAPGIQAYTRSVQGEGFARFMKSAAGAGRSE